MSGQATGWVLRYGPKDRAKRLVLLTIADAANRDGEHAHPGIAAIVDGSLYGRSTVLAKLRELVDEGWLEVEEEGKGRGHATVYRIPGIAAESGRERSDPRTLPAAKRSDPGVEKVRSGEPAPLIPTESNGTTTSETSSPRSRQFPKETLDRAWDAICEVVGWDPKTKPERDRVGKARKEILAAVPEDATAEHIVAAIYGRARRYRAEWPNAELSPQALAANWSRFGPKKGDDAPPLEGTAKFYEPDEATKKAGERIHAWHLHQKREAEAKGEYPTFSDPPEGWEPPDAPETPANRPEKGVTRRGRRSIARGALRRSEGEEAAG